MRSLTRAMVLTAGLALGGGALADGGGVRTYEVTITNITPALQFTPILAATHQRGLSYFELGEAASDEMALLAEDGNVGPLLDSILETGKVFDTANSADFLPPGPPLLFAGDTVTLEITAKRRARFLSLAAMLLPTNDSFVAIDSVRLPRSGSITVFARGYDAGSEPNDELCANIPGPTCNGTGASPDAGGEGFVHVSNGIHGQGDLSAAVYDWRNPVARIVIQRVY